MIYWNYIRKSLREHAGFILFSWILVGIFQLLMVTLVIEANILSLAQVFFNQFPPMVQQFVSEELLAQFSIGGAVAFGFNHPIVLIVLALVAITLPAKHIAGEIESGTLELMLSLPVNRTKLAGSLWVFSAAALLIIISGAWIGSLVGRLFYPQLGEIPMHRVIWIGLHLWLLMLVINAMAFAASVFSREQSKVAQRTAGLALLLYFLYYATKFSDSLHPLKYLSLFYYYQPQEIIFGRIPFWGDILLLSITLLLMIGSVYKFKNRGIPG
ncbi:MAG: ABC transporter permease subunit [Candidatus Zhuqueibacterota bacterium]